MSIDQQMHRIALSGATMGTRYSCVFYAPAPDGHETLARSLHEGITGIDDIMSNWKPDSVISRLNQDRLGTWRKIPESLMDVLAEALSIEAASRGAFDMGVGQLVAAWGFGPMAAENPTAPLATSLRAPTRSSLELDRTNMRVKKHAPLALDLSGIAKGYGVDHLGAILTEAGISSWLTGIDGEMRGQGTKPDGSFWSVGHERPVAGQREIMGVIELTDLAVATSGTYRHFREVDGVMVSHTIDPATGHPVTNAPASVTVLAGTCMAADAWATAIMVDGHWPPHRFPAPANIEVIMSAAGSGLA